MSENKNSTATNRKQSVINSETSGPLKMLDALVGFFLPVLLKEVTDSFAEVSTCQAHVAILTLMAAQDAEQELARKNVSVTDHCLVVINHLCKWQTDVTLNVNFQPNKCNQILCAVPCFKQDIKL